MGSQPVPGTYSASRVSVIIGLNILIASLLIISCKTQVEFKSDSVKREDTEYMTLDERCVSGVLYYQGWNSLAPAYNTDSTLKLCNY